MNIHFIAIYPLDCVYSRFKSITECACQLNTGVGDIELCFESVIHFNLLKNTIKNIGSSITLLFIVCLFYIIPIASAIPSAPLTSAAILE